jgi:nucleoside-diphosphate-sugar epimerase
MRVFVTGASGFIGSAVVPELIAAGHQVIGLARSDASAKTLATSGATVHHGSLDDLESLRTGAAASDGVIHLAYNHDFSQPVAAAKTDLLAIETLGSALEGSNRPLVVTSGLSGFAPGHVASETDTPDPSLYLRTANAQAALALVSRGVRSSILRLAPTVHGEGDPNFIAALIGIARSKGVSGSIGDGSNRWPAIHRGGRADPYHRRGDRSPPEPAGRLDSRRAGGRTLRLAGPFPGRRLSSLECVDPQPSGLATLASWADRRSRTGALLRRARVISLYSMA